MRFTKIVAVFAFILVCEFLQSFAYAQEPICGVNVEMPNFQDSSEWTPSKVDEVVYNTVFISKLEWIVTAWAKVNWYINKKDATLLGREIFSMFSDDREKPIALEWGNKDTFKHPEQLLAYHALNTNGKWSVCGPGSKLLTTFNVVFYRITTIIYKLFDNQKMIVERVETNKSYKPPQIPGMGEKSSKEKT